MKTKISFKQVTDTYVQILRGGEDIGQISSEDKEGLLPYPHEESEYVLNSIQICGFDKLVDTGACGPYAGKRDCVLKWIPVNEYIAKKKEDYKKYVESFFTTEKSAGIHAYSVVVPKDNVDLTEIKNFADWSGHDGYPKSANSKY